MAIPVTPEYQESLLLWCTFRDYETKILPVFYCKVCHTVVATLQNSRLETVSIGKTAADIHTVCKWILGFYYLESDTSFASLLYPKGEKYP